MLEVAERKATSKEEKDLNRMKTATLCPFMLADQPLLEAEILQ